MPNIFLIKQRLYTKIVRKNFMQAHIKPKAKNDWKAKILKLNQADYVYVSDNQKS